MRILLIYKDSVAVERMAVIQISAALKKAGHDVRLWIASFNKLILLHEIMTACVKARPVWDQCDGILGGLVQEIIIGTMDSLTADYLLLI